MVRQLTGRDRLALGEAAEFCTATGALLVLAAGRRRSARVVAGALLCAGSLLTRF